jgi:transposase
MSRTGWIGCGTVIVDGPSRGVSEAIKKRMVELAGTKYLGFNARHLTEKLVEIEKIVVSRETVRRLLHQAKLPSPQRGRARKYRARRERKPRLGMMVLTMRAGKNGLRAVDRR